MISTRAKKLLSLIKKNPVLSLLAVVLGGLILLGGAVDAAGKIWNTRKLFTQAKEDTDAISELRSGLKKQTDNMDVLVRDSNAAYAEIARVKTLALEAKDQIKLLGRLVNEATVELERLKKRNELTALADEAISQGSIASYRKLELLASNGHKGSTEGPEMAELFRVYSAYTGLAPSRIQVVTLNVQSFNPNKTKEEELTTEELMPSLFVNKDFHVRGRCAKLLSGTLKAGSFKSAELLVAAIKGETHLEVHRYLRQAFQHVTGFNGGSALDNTDIIKWWDEHVEEMRAKDTDKTAAPAK